MAAVIKTTLHTKDASGNTVDVMPATTYDQVEGYENFIKGIECDDHTLTLTAGDGSIFEVEIYNEVISDEEIRDLWGIINADQQSY